MTDKLTNWLNEPDLATLKKDLLAAQPYHDNMCEKIKEWNDARDIQGRFKPPVVKGRTDIQPKLIRKQAEWRYSALSEPFLSDRDIFKVSPNTSADVEAAAQSEMILNYQFREKIDRNLFIDNAVRAVCDDGVCFVRTEWDKQETSEKDLEPQWQYTPVSDPEVLQQLQQAIQLWQTSPKEALNTLPKEIIQSVKASIQSQQPVIAQIAGMVNTGNKKVVKNAPKLTVLNPFNFYFDPTCEGDLSNALFAIVSFETNKADLEAKGFYKNLDKVNWDSQNPDGSVTYQKTYDISFTFSDPARKKVIAHEYWGYYDVDNSGMLTPIVATWIDNVLIRMEENPFPDKQIPFVAFSYMPKRNSVYGEADAELLIDNQRIIGAATRTTVDLFAKSAASQTGICATFLDPINFKKYQNGQDYVYNPQQNPAECIYQHTFPEVSNSVFTLIENQLNEAESITGVKAFNNGISSEAYGSVATGIRGALDASSKREMNILRRIVNGLKKLGEKILAMDSLFLSDDEVIRITNKQFIQINKEDLKGNFDIDIDISTPEIDAAKAQDLAFMLQTIGNSLSQELTVYILSQIATLKHMPDLADKLANWQPPAPTAEQQQMQQLQLQQQMLQNELLKAQIAQVQSNTQYTAAKSDNIDSITHNNITGVTQQQDIDKQQAQAKANMKLAMVKTLLKGQKPDETPPNLAAANGYIEMNSNDGGNQ